MDNVMLGNKIENMRSEVLIVPINYQKIVGDNSVNALFATYGQDIISHISSSQPNVASVFNARDGTYVAIIPCYDFGKMVDMESFKRGLASVKESICDKSTALCAVGSWRTMVNVVGEVLNPKSLDIWG